MGKKSTLYLDEDLKVEVQIRLIKENKIKGENKSVSSLVNELLRKWLNDSK